MFYAHRGILNVRAPALAALVEECDTDTPFPIEEIEPDVFRQLLRFVYGGEVPNEFDLPEEAQDMIEAADRFGCTGLRVAAESKLVANDGINVDNAAGLILFADAKNCAELKEAAMDFFVLNSADIMKSDGFAKKELMSALACCCFWKEAQHRPAMTTTATAICVFECCAGSSMKRVSM